ncbi:MAG: hypothetical protein R3324_18875, partial [Halobacteriales archaeon]|nr:hypothetical protein [Halobacteriales archaeon]
MTDETISVDIDVGDGDVETLTLPEGLLELFAEEDDTRAGVIADILVLSLAQQIHGAVHHSHGETSPEVEEMEERTL